MKKTILCTFVLCFSIISFAQKPKTVQFAVIEIPPFFAENLPHQGAAAFALQELFKSMNYDVTLKFMPFKRAKAEALKDPELAGYGPCSENDLVDGFVLSKTVFQTKTLIIQNKDLPIQWKTPHDLAKYRAGSVKGYSLKSPIKEAFEKEHIQVEESQDDASNLLKLANRRVDYVFIADGMFSFLMMSDPRLREFAQKLEANPHVVTTVSWGIAFKKDDPKSMLVLRDLNDHVDPEKFTQNVISYMKKAKPSQK